MSNAYENFLCHGCKRYLISGWGRPNVEFRCVLHDGPAKYLCAKCDPKGCAECGFYNCDCKCTECDGVIVEIWSGGKKCYYQCKRCKKHYKNEYWLEASQ